MLRRPLIVAAALLDVLVVLVLAIREPTGGAFTVAAAVLLAPVGTFAVALLARRLEPSSWFPATAALAYALLPIAASLSFLSTYHATYRRDVAPALVGLSSPATLATGIAAALLVAFVPRRAAAVAGLGAVVAAAALYGFADLGAIRIGLHETAWSVTFLEWLAVAGAIGAARRSPSLALALAGWLVSVVLWGSHKGYDGGAFLRSLAAAWPAIAVLVSSLALLAPPLRAARVRSPGGAGAH